MLHITVNDISALRFHTIITVIYAGTQAGMRQSLDAVRVDASSKSSIRATRVGWWHTDGGKEPCPPGGGGAPEPPFSPTPFPFIDYEMQAGTRMRACEGKLEEQHVHFLPLVLG